MPRLGRSQPFKPQYGRPDLGLVYFDNFSTSPYEAALSTYNFTHVVGTNKSRLLVVGVSIFATGSVTSITYGGVNLSKLRADVNGIYDSEIWYLINPTSGSATVVVTLSTSLTSISGGASWWNADQFNPFSANAGGNGTNTPATASVTPGSANNRVFGNLSAQTANDTVTNKIDQAPHYRAGGALGSQEGSELGIILARTSTTLQWDGLGAPDSWAISLASIQPPQPHLPSSIIKIARQPTVARPTPHLTPFNLSLQPVAAALVAKQLIVIAKQPTVARPKPHLSPWLGPYPKLGSVSLSRIIIAKQPTVARPAPHLAPFNLPLQPVPPNSKSLLIRAKQPTVLRPAPHTSPLSIPLQPAVPLPPSRNLFVMTRTRVPPTHLLTNSVPFLSLPVSKGIPQLALTGAGL